MKPLEDRVAEELDRVAQRLVERVFTPGDERPVPELVRLGRTLFADDWPDDMESRSEDANDVARAKAHVLAQLLRLGGDQLEETFGGITEQEAVLRLFNLSGGTSRPEVVPVTTTGLDGKVYSHIRTALLEKAGILPQSRNAYVQLNRLRTRLARTLIDLAVPVPVVSEPAKSASGVLVIRSVVTDEYVPRPAYEQEIRQLRDAGEPHVWLWGDAGTGKTRLARAANRDRIAERSVRVLAAGNAQALDAQLAELLVSVGVPAAAVNPTNSRAHFVEQLAKETLPKVLVLDDAPVEPIVDGSLIGALCAARGSFLIFTSIGAPPAAYCGPRIEIREMTDAESEQMIRSRLPQISDPDLAQLRQTLGARPLAIEHSCAFLRETGLPVFDYCHALTREPAATLDAAGEQYGRTLTQVYRMILGRLSSSTDVLRALDLLVFSTDLMTLSLLAEVWMDGLELPAAMPDSPGEIDNDYLRSASLWCGAWTGVKYIDPTRLPKIDPVKSVALRQALRRLEAFGLVRADGARLVMHQLTRAVLRALRDDQADNIYQRIRQTVYDTVRAENWKGGDALSVTRLWWAPQLREALARAIRTIPDLSQVSMDDAIRLATLAAVMMRAHRQVGIDPAIVVDDAARAAVAALVRHQLTPESDPGRPALWTAYTHIHTELLEFFQLQRGFDRSADAFPRGDQEPTPFQRWAANTIRLKHATEWDLARHYLTPEEQQAREHNTVGWRLGATGEHATITRVRASAEDAITVATIYYDQARWDAAIDALEHAYGCYLQIGASVEAIRGAIDAGRRLARVHLRAGHLEKAAVWLDRIVREVYQQRSECTFNGKPSPFKLVDRLLEAQVQQARAELETIALVLEWDKPDTEITSEIIATVLEPRLEHAKQAVELVRALRANRLVPEFSMHALRLQILTNTMEGIDALSPQFDHNREPYRAALSQLQVHTLLTPFMATMLMLSEAEFEAYRQTLPVEQTEFAGQVRAARGQMGNQLVELAQEVGVTHGNPYWHVRGVCAAAILATAAGADPAWAASLRDTAKEGARNIGRPDWADKIDGLWETNGGLWLLGY